MVLTKQRRNAKIEPMTAIWRGLRCLQIAIWLAEALQPVDDLSVPLKAPFQTLRGEGSMDQLVLALVKSRIFCRLRYGQRINKWADLRC